MRYQVKALLEDESELVATVDGRDIRRWEAKEQKSFLGEPLSVSILTELAFFAAKRTGQTALTWNEFDAQCVGVEEAESSEASDVRPTRKARGGSKQRR